MKKVWLSILFAVGLIGTTAAQSTAKVDILTSVQCHMCEEKIENDLRFVKGIVNFDVDPHTKILSVEYKTKKITPDQIRQEVSKIGYDADNVKADVSAFKALPDCCKSGCHPHEDHNHGSAAAAKPSCASKSCEKKCESKATAATKPSCASKSCEKKCEGSKTSAATK